MKVVKLVKNMKKCYLSSGKVPLHVLHQLRVLHARRVRFFFMFFTSFMSFMRAA